MRCSNTTVIANGSHLFDLPNTFSAYREEDGTIAAVLEANPDLFTVRFSALTVTPPDPSQHIDLAAHTMSEAKSQGRAALRAAGKAWLETEKYSEENGAPIYLRFWTGGFRHDKFIISLCCAADAATQPLVAAACKDIVQVISTIRERPEKSPLTEMEAEYLQDQRDVVLNLLRDRYDTFQAPKLRSDLAVIQRIIDDELYTADHECEWSCLGVIFGDVLAHEFGLQWIVQSDDYGVEPALNLDGTSIVLYPRTMLIKRFEQGEAPDLNFLFEKLCESLEDLRRKGC